MRHYGPQALLRSTVSLALSILLVSGCGTGGGGSDTGSGGSSAAGGSPGSGGSNSGKGGSSSGGSTGSGGNGSGGSATGGVNGSGGNGSGGSATGGVNGSGGNGSGGSATGGGTGSGGNGSGGSSTGGVTGSGGGTGSGGSATGSGGAAGATGKAGNGGSGTGGAAGTTGKGGSGGAGTGGAAGKGGSGGSGTSGAAGTGPEAPGGRVSGYGTVSFTANSQNQIVRLQTTLTVPAEPPASGTLFLWPGLQPNGAHFDPIGNGVLQPVLTWGNSCAPGTQPHAYSTWWISAQYVNTDGSDPGYMGCYGGSVMSVKVGDELNIDMQLAGTAWTQTVTDEQSGQSVNFSFDMMDQTQNIAYFVIEEYSSAPVSEVIFTSTTLTFASSDAGDCKLAMRGQTDLVSVPVASSDGLRCVIQEIVLRAQGIQ